MNNLQTLDCLRQAEHSARKEQSAIKPGLAQRVIWMQDEDTGKWVLVGLSETGEVQDPQDYEDVQAPLPNQPSGRIWARDDEGKWVNVRTEASKEETARAVLALRKAQAAQSYVPNNNREEVPHQQTWKPARFTPRHHHRGNRERPSRPSLTSVHRNYALRLSGQKEAFEVVADPIAEEDSVASDGDEGGVRYHRVKPGDTFNFICLKYKISADALRAANDFSGSTLQSAPKKLIIPSPSSSPGSRGREGSREAESIGEGTTPSTPSVVQSPVPSVSSSVATEKVSMAAAAGSPPRHLAVPRLDPAPKAAPATESPEGREGGPPLEIGQGCAASPREGSRLPEGKKEEEEGVRYHWVEPDDSLRWICLKYKVNANDLRRANNFTGSNLKIAPKKLIIPPPSRTMGSSKSRSYRRPRAGDGSTISGSMGTRSLSQRSLADDDSIGHSSFFSSNSKNSSLEFKEGRLYVPRGVYVPKNSTGTAGSSVDGTNHVPNADDVSVMTTNTALHAPISMVSMTDVQKLSLYIDHASDSSDSEAELDGNAKPNGPRYHDVRPNDTIEFLCMKYRVSAAALRRANIGLTGRNLQTGPKRLIIPAKTNTSSMTGYFKKNTRDTADTVTLTTMGTHTLNDETNTLAFSDGLSDGHSLAEQMAALDGEGSSDDDTLYHDVQPSDTLQGLCLLYGVTAYELRRANNFRGLSLSTAPERLVIPQGGRTNRAAKGFRDMTEDEKIRTLMAHLPTSRQTNKPLLSREEARAYLEYNDWNFDQALRNAKVDSDWSSQRNLMTR